MNGAPTRTRRAGGFTLIELMITVAIIAILASVAIPAYQDSVWKGKRGEAKAAILRTLQTQERWYTQNNSYQAFTTATGPFSTFSADNANNSRYVITADATTSGASCAANDQKTCVRVIATVKGTPDPKCGTTLSMDTAGVKQSGTSNAVCWN